MYYFENTINLSNTIDKNVFGSRIFNFIEIFVFYLIFRVTDSMFLRGVMPFGPKIDPLSPPPLRNAKETILPYYLTRA